MALEQNIDQLHEKHIKSFDELDKSPLIKLQGSITDEDVLALGTQLDNTEEAMSYMAEANTAADLGAAIPRLARSLVVANFGSNPLTAIASNQTLNEVSGQHTGLVH